MYDDLPTLRSELSIQTTRDLGTIVTARIPAGFRRWGIDEIA